MCIRDRGEGGALTRPHERQASVPGSEGRGQLRVAHLQRYLPGWRGPGASFSLRLLGVQRACGVHPGGAPGGQQARRQRHRGERRGEAREGERVQGLHAEEQGAQPSGERRRPQQAREAARRHHAQRLAHHQPEHRAAARAQREPDAELARALGDEEGGDAVDAQRTREFGIRLALGARGGAVLGLVMRQALGVVAVGCALGLLGAAALSGGLRAFLFGVEPLDPLTFATLTLGLAAVALTASLLPAWRATRVDPSVALRAE